MLLDFAIHVELKSNFLNDCAPVILQFLNQKNIFMDLSYLNLNLLTFLSKYPEGLALVNRFELSVHDITLDEEGLKYNGDFGSQWDVPVVDKEYAKAFVLLSDEARDTHEKNYVCRNRTSISQFGINQSEHKISILHVEARGKNILDGIVTENLLVFLSLSRHIELVLKKCPGFVKNVATCIEQHRTSFVKCVIFTVELTMEEQELITQMPSLESLQIINATPPEYILSHLDNFKHLKELSLDLSDNGGVFEVMAEGFKKLNCLEKVAFKHVNLGYDSSRLADCISDFPDLKTFHFTYDVCPDFGKLMAAICKHGNIYDLSLRGLFIKESEMIHLALHLSSLKNLRALNLEGQYFADVEEAKIFAQSLLSLVQLEELSLPSGPGIMETLPLVIKQLKTFPKLRKLGLKNNILNDYSVLQLAKVARKGHLSNVQKLSLDINYNITQSGWTDFFHTLDNLENLTDLCISRIYTHQFKMDPSTLVALVQCVSRLHRLNVLVLLGWLLDNKDLEMFDSMKQKHPQGKSFTLIWQWLLPVNPTVLE
uniref:Uncharacterized protein n=1 Tax=Leptobrachium leishanense TaxID=445787 RepID=A0A8C5LJ22_9ANUR